jgi:hypothetical protein
LILLTERTFCRHDSFRECAGGIDQTEASSTVSDEKGRVCEFGRNVMERRFRDPSYSNALGPYPDKWCLALSCFVLVKRLETGRQTDIDGESRLSKILC